MDSPSESVLAATEIPQVVLTISQDQRQRVVVGQTSAAQVRELELRTLFAFNVTNMAGREVIPSTSLALTRSLNFSETAVLAKEAEEAQLFNDMQNDMVSQVMRATAKKDWIVFLGWAPHPMNSKIKMTYLSGGDDFFGPNYGGATVYTNVRKGYTQECSNVGQLLKNLSFTLNMESTLMGNVLDDKMKPDAAAKAWLKKNPQVLDTWLAGVTTVDGKPGLEAVKAYLAK